MQIQIEFFKGKLPKLSPHLLENEQSQELQNASIESGDIRSWLGLEQITGTGTTPPTGCKTVKRWPANSTVYWLFSTNDLDFAGCPVANDVWERLYYTGESQPRYLANDVIGTPFDFSTDYVKLAKPQPTSTLVTSGYTTGTTYRAYFHTYVSRYGEESIPSTLETLTDYGSGRVQISGFTAPSDDSAALLDTVNGYRPSTYLYRTNSSDAGTAEFQFVLQAYWFNTTDTYEVGQFVVYSGALYECTTQHTGAWNGGNFTAGELVNDADLGEICPSINWSTPNDDLEGLIGLPNGIMAAFIGNKLYFSEPYLPHAWPTTYFITFDYKIVGIAPMGASIVVLTEGNPYLVSGVHPTEMTAQKYEAYWPCRSKRSIKATPWGIVYSANEGYVLIDQNGPQNLLQKILTANQWLDYDPESIIADYFYNKIFIFYNSAELGKGGFIYLIDQAEMTDLDFYIECSTYGEDGNYYVVKRENPLETDLLLYQWEGDQYNYLQYYWKSRRFILPTTMNFSVAQVIPDLEWTQALEALLEESNYLATLNAALFATGDISGDICDDEINGEDINGDGLYDISSLLFNTDINFKLYVDNVLKFEKIVSSDKPFKLPSGYKGRRVEVELRGYVPVKRLILATSMRELPR